MNPQFPKTESFFRGVGCGIASAPAKVGMALLYTPTVITGRESKFLSPVLEELSEWVDNNEQYYKPPVSDSDPSELSVNELWEQKMCADNFELGDNCGGSASIYLGTVAAIGFGSGFIGDAISSDGFEIEAPTPQIQTVPASEASEAPAGVHVVQPESL